MIRVGLTGGIGSGKSLACQHLQALNYPVFSCDEIYKEIIMFTKTFASLINYDVFITDSMEILTKITNNEIYNKEPTNKL